MLTEITRAAEDSKGRYAAVVNGVEAELTYSVASPTVIIADHTGVPDALRGKGVGLALVKRMIVDAQGAGVKIVPLCAFVNTRARRHPEWAGAFAR